MMSVIFNWQNYFFINISFLLGLLFLKPILQSIKLSQQAKLHFIRRYILLTIVIFLGMPIIFAIQPQPKISYSLQTIPIAEPSSLVSFIILGFLLGFMIATVSYLKKIVRLNTLRKSCILYRKIKHTHLIISNGTSIFCFSFLNNHFIVIPFSYLELPHLRLSVRHELQHIRQGDTYWLHIFALLKIICYWNPAIYRLTQWCVELQEFACDEALILKNKNSLSAYAECLLQAASHQVQQLSIVLAMNGSSSTSIYRRLTMLFKYQPIKKTFLKSVMYSLSFLGITTCAYAANSLIKPLTTSEVAKLITPSYSTTMHISATPEVVKELNRIRENPKSLQNMRAALERMETYKPVIQEEMLTRHVPNDLFAMPILQSGFRPLPQSANPMQAAGIWQIIPSTAKTLGLTVTANRDDRLDTKLSTKAALDYLQTLYKQFKDWKLAVIAYEMGEDKTDALIKQTGSKNAWEIAHKSDLAPDRKTGLLHYLANFDATVIILHNPHLVKS